MVSFLKTCGKGLLCVIACPFAIALVCCYAIVGILIFFFLIGKSVVLFFKGQTIFSDLPEDIEAKKILSARNEPIDPTPVEPESNNDNSPLSLYPSDSNMYKSDFSGLNEIKHQPEETPVEEQPKVEITRVNEETPKTKDDEVIGTYKPLSSNNKDDE